MNVKQKTALVGGAGLLMLVGGIIAGSRIIRGTGTLVSGPQGAVAQAIWVDQGATVAEMAAQADLIVRVRVLSSETRELRSTLPQYEEDAETITRYVEEVMSFTDSQMQVLEVYKGSAEDTITVMQTGGLPGAVAADATPFSLFGDPIFIVGSEHILFLVDITNDGVHSTGRNLYRTMNPFGRYEIKDGVLITPADVLAGREAIPPGLPTTLDELVEQIKQAVNN